MAALSGTTLLNLGILLGAAFIVGELFERIGLESILGYIVTGLVLGPSVLSVMEPGSVKEFGTIGATLILFQAGLKEENIQEIFLNRDALLTGLSLFFGAFIFIFAALNLFGGAVLPFTGFKAFFFIALAYALVDIGVPSKVMLSHGILERPEGIHTIKSAVVNVTVGFLAVTLAAVALEPSLETQALKLASIAGFALGFFLVHELMKKIDDYVMMFEETEAQFALTVSLLLFLSYITKSLGLSSILGAFFAGVLISRSEFSSSKAFKEKIRAISEGLFIPVFFAWFGLGLQVDAMVANAGAAAFLFILSFIPKSIIAYITTREEGLEKASTVAASLISIDIETLVALLIAKDLGIFTDQILQIFAPAVLFSTLSIITLYAFIEKQ